MTFEMPIRESMTTSLYDADLKERVLPEHYCISPLYDQETGREYWVEWIRSTKIEKLPAFSELYGLFHRHTDTPPGTSCYNYRVHLDRTYAASSYAAHLYNSLFDYTQKFHNDDINRRFFYDMVFKETLRLMDFYLRTKSLTKHIRSNDPKQPYYQYCLRSTPFLTCHEPSYLFQDSLAERYPFSKYTHGYLPYNFHICIERERVSLFAIESTKKGVHLDTYSLSHSIDGARLLMTLAKIFQIGCFLSQTVPHDAYAEVQTIQRSFEDSSGACIKFTADTVVYEFTPALDSYSRYINLDFFYSVFQWVEEKKIPGTLPILELKVEKETPYFKPNIYNQTPPKEKVKKITVCAPRGMSIPPQNYKQFKDCVTTMFSVLVEFHAHGWCHRDIRLNNIIYLEAEDQWCLIDYDRVAVFGAHVNWSNPLLPDTTEYFPKHDLYMVSNLIQFSNFPFTPETIAFKEKLQNYEIESAAAALEIFRAMNIEPSEPLPYEPGLYMANRYRDFLLHREEEERKRLRREREKAVARFLEEKAKKEALEQPPSSSSSSTHPPEPGPSDPSDPSPPSGDKPVPME